MEKMVLNVLKELDQRVGDRNREADRDGFIFQPNFEIKILGQMSLLLNRDISAKIDLSATVDLDSYINGEVWIGKEFESLLKNNNVILDKDSDLIWMPQESTYTLFFEGDHVKSYLVDPIYCIASKAIKAKEKNRTLVIQALLEYGKPLEQLILKHGGNLEYFYE